MAAVPDVTPDTTPVPDTTVAVLVELLLHVPPLPSGSNKDVVAPMHTLVVPVTTGGNGLMVINAVLEQPVLSE